MAYGVTSTGFNRKPLTQILADIQADQRAEISIDFQNEAHQPDGQNNAIFARQLSLVWEAVEAVAAILNPDATAGKGLDIIGAIRGSLRAADTPSVVQLSLSLDAATTVTSGSLAKQPGENGVTVELINSVTSTTAGDYVVNAKAVTTGPIAIPAGTVTEIVTATSGWTAVTNPGDAELGTDAQTDPEYYIAQESAFRAIGSASQPALREDLQDLIADGAISYAEVYVNESSTVDSNLQSPYTVQAVVYGPGGVIDNDAVANTIWQSKAGGVPTFGNTFTDIVDTSGVTRRISYSIAENVEITIEATVVKGSTSVLSDVELKTAVKTALVEAAELGGTIRNQPGALLLEDLARLAIYDVRDVAQVTAFAMYRTGLGSATAGDIQLKITEIGDIDASRITVTVA